MPRHEENPPLNRLKWVAQQYKNDPHVVLHTYRVLFHTVVGDHVASAVFNEAMQDAEARPADIDLFAGLSLTRGGRKDGPTTHDLSTEAASRMVAALFQQLRTYGGGVIERTARIDRRRYDTDPLWPWVAREISKYRKLYLDVADPFAQVAYGVVMRTRDKANAIALWAKAERVDLGKVSLEEALHAVEDFEVSRKTIPQGHVVHDYGDGWTVQLLQTPEELKAEGEVMQHCVGEYYDAVARRDSAIFSIRDPEGRPHVTIEWASTSASVLASSRGDALLPQHGRIEQIQGKQNEPPAEKYRGRVIDFLKAWPEKGIDLPKFLLEDEAESAAVPDLVPAARARLVPWSKALSLLSMGAAPQTLRLDFSEVDFFELTEAGARLATVFQGLDLSGADFSKSVLNEFDLRKTVLREAKLRGASLVAVVADEIDLRGADLRPANGGMGSVTFLTDAVMKAADLTDARFDRANLERAVLCGATVDGTVFDYAILQGAQLYQLLWRDTPPSFKAADARYADLEDPRLYRLLIRDRALVDARFVDEAIDLGIATPDDFEKTEDADMDTFRARRRAA